MDIIGYVFVGLIFLTAVIISIYLFVHFSHPMDSDYLCAYFVKIWIIIGMVISSMMIFIIPVDYLSSWKM